MTVRGGLRDMRDARRGVCCRSQLKWQRDGDEWLLLYRRRRMGRVVPDRANPRIYRSLKSGDFSDIQSELGQGRRAGSGHKGGRLRTCK